MIVEFVNKFKKDFKRAPDEIQDRVLDIIKTLENAENINSLQIDIKRMEGQKKGESYYRIRVGDWRIGCEILQPNILLLRLMSRGDVYKHFPPK